MDSRIIKTIALKNKLVLNLYDESVKMVGDRWLVTMAARIKIPVDMALIQEDHFPLPSQEEIKRMLGANVVFEHKTNRLFVDQTEKKNILQELSDTFIKNTMPYLSHHDFPRRFLVKKIKEEKNKQSYKR